VVALAGDDAGDQRLPAVLRAAIAVVVGFLLRGHRCRRPQRSDRRVEIDLRLCVKGLDLAQSRLGLAVPAARPADRMANWLVRRVAADDPGREIASLLQLGKIAVACRPGEPPVDVKLVIVLAAAVSPATAALYHDRGWSEYLLQCFPRLLWVFIALDGQRQAFGDVLLSRPILVGKDRQRRAEDDRLRVLCRPPCIIFGHVDQKPQPACQGCAAQPERLVVAFEEGANGDKSLRACMAEDRVDKLLDLVAVGLEHGCAIAVVANRARGAAVAVPPRRAAPRGAPVRERRSRMMPSCRQPTPRRRSAAPRRRCRGMLRACR
jgi:hypothetical protein